MVIDLLISLAISNALISPAPVKPGADFVSSASMASDGHIDYHSGERLPTIGDKFTVGDGVAFTVKDMFYVMLTDSANNAARAIAHTTGLTEEDFTKAMN